jgi:hypothetical protein
MTAGVPTAWWSVADVDELTQMMAARRSRLWQVADPADLAAWVFAEPEPAPLDPAPAAFNGDWTSGLDEAQRTAWALAGWVTRMTVPEAASTAGKHWILSRVDQGGGPLLRLTVGVLETFGVRESGEEVWLRVLAQPLDNAIESGALDPGEWERRGVEVLGDRTKTRAEDKYLLRCPDIDTACWLLGQSPVMAGARALSAWLAAGPFSFESRYRSEVAARAWLAAEALLDAGAGGGSAASVVGFDRPYAAPAVPAALTAQRSFDADAYRAGVDDHDRLCRQLIDHLSRSGVRAGAGLHGVPVDLGWRDGAGEQFIAEVKSVVGANAVDQLRLGLGQVLEYRHRLAALGVPTTAVLLVSRCDDPAWRDICADTGVTLQTGDGEPAWAALVPA